MPVMPPWCLSAVAAVSIAVAQPAAPITTVQGEVVDLECALQEAESCRGEANARRIMDVAREGKAMAIAAAGAVYRIEGDYTANRNAKLLDFVGRRVEAKGTVRDEQGRLHLNVAAMMVLKPSAPAH
jgi:hypothetical protein